MPQMMESFTLVMKASVGFINTNSLTGPLTKASIFGDSMKEMMEKRKIAKIQ
jgi:hypothetical protein